MKPKSGVVYKMLAVISALSGLFSCSDTSRFSIAGFDKVKSGFIIPADTNKVWCYWCWLNDDISKEGITNKVPEASRVYQDLGDVQVIAHVRRR